MGRWYQISSILKPELGLRSCSHDTHRDLIDTLHKVSKLDQMPFCSQVAEIGYYWNDIYLNQLSDFQLRCVVKRLPETKACLLIAKEVEQVLVSRWQFRHSIHPRSLLAALLRDRFKCKLETVLDGQVNIARVYEYAARHGRKEQLKPLIEDFFQRHDQHRDPPDRGLILRGCMDVDRIM